MRGQDLAVHAVCAMTQVTYGTEPIAILRTEWLVAFNPGVARWDHNFLYGVWRERLDLRISIRIQMRPYGSWCRTRTIFPGSAMIRFTSISLGLIGELPRRASVREADMRPNGTEVRRTIKRLRPLSCIRDVSWSRRGRRGLSLSRGRSRDSRWADHSEREETSVRKRA